LKDFLDVFCYQTAPDSVKIAVSGINVDGDLQAWPFRGAAIADFNLYAYIFVAAVPDWREPQVNVEVEAFRL
jgi:hypothetical protein